MRDSAQDLLLGKQATWGCTPDWLVNIWCFSDCKLDCSRHRLVSSDSWDWSESSSSVDFAVCIEAMDSEKATSDCSSDSMGCIW